MNTLRPLAPALIASLIWGTVAKASEPATAPSPLLILEQMKQASGGGNWDRIRTLSYTTLTHGGGVDIPGSREEDVRTGRYVDFRYTAGRKRGTGFDGITPWVLPRGGIAYAWGDTDATLNAASEAFRTSRAWWYSDRQSATIAYRQARSEQGHSYDVLAITPEGGRTFDIWIDSATHLLYRIDEQEAEDREVETFGDYRPVGGIMLPFTTRLGDGSDPDSEMIRTLRTVRVNSTVPDTDYAIPAIPPPDIAMPAGVASVDVPFRLTADNRLIVPVTLNGHMHTEAEFDTGGSLMIGPSVVSALAAKTAGQLRMGGGGEGHATTSIGHLETLDIGGAIIKQPGFHTHQVSRDYPNRILIGLETLQRFVVHFDFDRSIMTLTIPDAFSWHGNGKIVPFHFQDNQPEIFGSIDGIAGRFAVDTGDSGSLLLIAPFARRHDLVQRYHADIPYAGTSISATHGVWARKRVHTVSFDGSDGRSIVEAHDPITRISTQHAGFDANRNVSANIGLGILKQFNLTFDYTGQQIIFEPNHLFGAKDIFNRTGFRVTSTGTAWKISTIYSGSPAEKAGLQTGDIVEEINGHAPAELNSEDLSRLMNGPPGSTMHVSAIMNGHRKIVKIVLKELIP
ncbi:hypothetical protein AD940_00765 [Gluconobacter thailandicus]|uniref:PDZ domain-containing protein n=1 Tax=Gluconobacter thailandicus TaxID=257438 RepID=UPI000777A75F|nr:PDZ domain-containing protein [Gluconobacter thailandicus]KXV36018.1 hypothetical protein AD940_00765 [Gluconobacter thailandicus]